MMKKTALALTFFAALPGLAAAQTAFEPQALFNSVTCAQFSALGMEGQIAALQALPAAGDDLGAEDPGALESWTRQIEAACLKEPNRTLADVATGMLGGGLRGRRYHVLSRNRIHLSPRARSYSKLKIDLFI